MGDVEPNKKDWLICGPHMGILYHDNLNYKQDWQGGLSLLNIAAFGVAMETRQIFYSR
jgi:hypothetical protein